MIGQDEVRAKAKGRPDRPEVEDGKLPLRTWLRLLACSNLIKAALARNLREAFTCTLPRFDLLAQLERAPEALSMSELSKRLMVSNSNVTGLIDRLEGEGLVVRAPAPADRRTQHIRLTEAGRARFRAMSVQHRAWTEELFSGLTREEAGALSALLGTLKASLERRKEERGTP